METPATRRIPALDGLRGVAILLVLLWHGVFGQYVRSPWLVKLFLVGKLSWSGVDLFFVLSGFLIGGILLDAKNSPHYYSTFYLRRAYRILPLYAAVLVFYFLLRPTSLGAWLGFDLTQVPAWSFLTFTQNIWMAFAGKFGGGGMSPTWSLAIEEQFYLLIPLLVRKLSRLHLTIVLIATVVCAPVLRAGLFFVPHGEVAAYVLMPCRADALSLGVLAAILVRWRHKPTSHARLWWLAGLLLLPLAWLSCYSSDPFSKPMATYGYSLLALFYACCLLLALSGQLRILETHFLRNLGSIAYGTYLLHFPLFLLAARLANSFLSNRTFEHAGGISAALGATIGIGLALLLASLSWRFFEQPLLRRAHRYRY